jgi:mannose-6-phosphate isomerase-like protein (cupin superfamily)
MKRFTAAVVVALAALAVVIAAYATPGVEFTSTVVARGTLGADMVFGVPEQSVVTRHISVRVGKRVVHRTVKLTVPSIQKAISCGEATPCDTAFQSTTVPPGGTSGWHAHPGATFVAVAQGEATLYTAGDTICPPTKVPAGSGFVQLPTDVHVLRNEGSAQLVMYTLYVLPRSTPNTGIRIDHAQPALCTDIH